MSNAKKIVYTTIILWTVLTFMTLSFAQRPPPDTTWLVPNPYIVAPPIDLDFLDYIEVTLEIRDGFPLGDLVTPGSTLLCDRTYYVYVTLENMHKDRDVLYTLNSGWREASWGAKERWQLSIKRNVLYHSRTVQHQFATRTPDTNGSFYHMVKIEIEATTDGGGIGNKIAAHNFQIECKR